jgi:hypothetical protein
VIDRICNPAHCSTRGFLEVLDRGIPPRVRASVPIVELNEKWWTFVERVEVVPGEAYHFDLYAIDTHGTEAGFTLRVTPTDSLGHEAVMRDVRSGADPLNP